MTRVFKNILHHILYYLHITYIYHHSIFDQITSIYIPNDQTI